MKLKKITSILAIALTIFATTTTFGQGVYAAEKSSTSISVSATKSSKINANTVITKDNLSSVLKYVGLNPNDAKKSKATEESVKTVDDLQNAIKQAKQQKITITSEKVANKSGNTTTKSSNAIVTLGDDDDTPSSTQRCYHKLDCTAYSVTFVCFGEYRHGQWCGVSGGDATVSGKAKGYTFDLTINDISLNYDSQRIDMYHDVKVVENVTVAGWDIPVNTNTIKGHDYFNIEDWV